MSKKTRVNFMSTAGGQLMSDSETFTTLESRIDPETRRRDKATQTSIRNRFACFTNSRCAKTGSDDFLSRGTATRERNSIPPTQNVAAVRCIQTRRLSNTVISRIVTRFARLHYSSDLAINNPGIGKTAASSIPCLCQSGFAQAGRLVAMPPLAEHSPRQTSGVPCETH